ncbi:MAG: sulfite exporter TauE/SafE family protein [Acidobacteriota bacterium]
MDSFLLMTIGLAFLAIISGMLGLGVAFAAVPFLSLFLPDFVNQVQPLTLLLNGLTALFAMLGFARSGNVIWKDAVILSLVTTVSAPAGAYLAQHVTTNYILYAYFAAVLYLAYSLFRPIQRGASSEAKLVKAIFLAIPISVLAGFLGIGPGFLLMPSLILLGYEPKKAAGINSLTVTPPSFSALVPHLPTAVWDPNLTVTLLVVGSLGSFFGARLTSLYVPSVRLKQLFGIVIVVMTAYKILTLF